MGMEIVGIAFGFIGFIIAIVTCALPMWKVTAFIGANIITAQTIWEGLWMNCVIQSTGQMQCKVYDSMLALSQELQASRAMTIISIILAVMGVLISIVGAKCTNCIEDEPSKAKVMIISGIFFILAGLLVLVPVSWTSSVIVRDFYNPIITDAQRREMGASLYIGFGAAVLLLIGGAMLCASCPPSEKKYKPPRMMYSTPRSTSAGGGYDRKDYVWTVLKWSQIDLESWMKGKCLLYVSECVCCSFLSKITGRFPQKDSEMKACVLSALLLVDTTTSPVKDNFIRLKC